MSDALPIDAILPDVRETLGRHRALVLEAPPGAGKTTRVPLSLLDEPWLAGRKILMLEPRRLAARAAAQRMADLLAEKVGETVGCTVRFERRVSERTRIEVLTEGILTRRLQSDPELAGVGLVIFDEFHERHLDSDLALALCADAAEGLRDDLRLLVMSATLDGERVAELLRAPSLRSEGRSYPVTVQYLPEGADGPLPQAAAAAVRRAVRQESGDILVFLPGAGEIRRTAEVLGGEGGLLIHPLYGNLSQQAQQAAIVPDPQGRRKVVLATNIAETSLTIEGIRVVIDGGWMRVPRFDPAAALTRLETVRVSRASAEQRKGRAGRLGPGVCYRLWSEKTQEGLVPYNMPEILTADLAGLALELARWGVTDPADLQWLDEPSLGSWLQARELLTGLDALDGRGLITAEGQAMARMPTHPRLAHMLYRAKGLGAGSLACDVAALLEERDILSGTSRDCDFVSRVEALSRFRRDGRAAARALGADPEACSRAERAAKQFRRLLGEADTMETEVGIGLLLALAYPDRVAQPRSGNATRYRLANGRGAKLAPECPMAGRWLVAANLGGNGTELVVRLAATTSREELEEHLPEHLTAGERVEWDARSESVVAASEVRFGKLVLESEPLGHPDSGAVAATMLEGIRQMGLQALPWSDEAKRLRARIAFLHHHFPEQEWPDLSDSALAGSLDWLAPFLTGIRRRDHLRQLNMAAILLARLEWDQQQKLEEGAPERVALPSGRNARLDYSEPESPVLAVKLQEMFGQADTPRVGWGRVPVTLHLLSPAQRPIQVTRDLKGFWERTYAEVKKELKGRYPKHPWPDDPWSAVPTGRTKKRM